jgi:hypothetical protein
MILYYPVSALVTLFANILQNPQDARARADVKLMTTVVNFLSQLSIDEGNGSVKRMLGVCAEFERIAKVVLDKSDKESHSRRKRKSAPEDKAAPKTMPTPSQNSPMRNAGQGPATAPPLSQFSPSFTGTPGAQSTYASSMSGYGSPPTQGMQNGDMSFMPDLGNGDFGDVLTPQNGFGSGFSDAGGQPYPASAMSPLNLGSFQHPFVPQDLWQMPMTLEWDWAEMTSAPYGMDATDGQVQGVPR